MKVLLDTNILIDFALMRQPFYGSSERIIALCDNKTIDGYVAAHTIVNMLYILRKDYSISERRSILKEFCEILTVIGIEKKNLINALNNDAFTDVEDCLQFECAKSCGADYIVTRNIKDFTESTIPVLEPYEFLKLLNI